MASTDSLLIYLGLVSLLPIIFWVLNKILGPNRPHVKKRLSFESGQVPFEWRSAPFPVEYFPYLIIYVAYAVLSIIVFLGSVTMLESPDSAVKAVLLLAVLSASSLYLAYSLKDLSQRF